VSYAQEDGVLQKVFDEMRTVESVFNSHIRQTKENIDDKQQTHFYSITHMKRICCAQKTVSSFLVRSETLTEISRFVE